MDVDRLLDCARWFHGHCPEGVRPLPDTYETEAQALEAMRDALLFEAHHALRGPLAAPPDLPLSNAVDLGTETPGIAHTRGGRVHVHRSEDSVREIAYEVGRQQPVDERDESEPPPPLTEAKRRRFLEAAERSEARAHQASERRATRACMSKEERAEQARERREARERRKAESAEADGQAVLEPAHEPALAPVDEAPDDAAEPDDAAAPDDAAEPSDEAASPTDAAESAVSAPRLDEMPPPRRKRGSESMVFHESPAPHDRYLTALTSSALHPALRDTILRGIPADNASVRITNGPPGCGKTKVLLDQLEEFHASRPEARCLVCGPTNLSAADLYRRAFARGLVGCLALAKEHMPPGAPRPRALDVRRARFVFATVAARSGRLCDERFHAVFLDEAGLCSESATWGLLRPDVHHLVMTGDVHQLAARASREGTELGHQRSLMERLLAIGVRADHLTMQHRMHAAICDFPSREFYRSALVTAPVDRGMAGVPPYALVDVRGTPTAVGTSTENTAEAEAALREAMRLRDAGLSTVLVAPYAAQVRRLRAAQSGIEVHTVDSFQGKESDAVVLSLVRTPSSGAGFWEDGRRVNVALTRARHALRVVGHGGWCDADGPLARLARDARDRGLVE